MTNASRLYGKLLESKRNHDSDAWPAFFLSLVYTVARARLCVYILGVTGLRLLGVRWRLFYRCPLAIGSRNQPQHNAAKGENMAKSAKTKKTAKAKTKAKTNRKVAK
jgi:hypothetical protein